MQLSVSINRLSTRGDFDLDAKVIGLMIIVALVIIVAEALIIKMLRNRIKQLKPKYKLTKYRFKRLNFNNRSLKMLDSLNGIQFENLCCELLHTLGYSKISKTRTTGDFGLDILCEKDGVKYGIQCKCYSSSIGVDAIQQAYAGCAYYKCDVPVVMSNMYYTDAAQELARVIGVTLWSRHFFLDEIGKLQHNRKVMHDIRKG